MSSLIALSYMLLIVAIGAGYIWAARARSQYILKKWAERNQFELVNSKNAFFMGPFSFWKTSRSQTVLFVTIRDKEHQVRSGWLRCGGFWGGVLFSNKADVIWDKS